MTYLRPTLRNVRMIAVCFEELLTNEGLWWRAEHVEVGYIYYHIRSDEDADFEVLVRLARNETNHTPADIECVPLFTYKLKPYIHWRRTCKETAQRLFAAVKRALKEGGQQCK